MLPDTPPAHRVRQGPTRQRRGTRQPDKGMADGATWEYEACWETGRPLLRLASIPAPDIASASRHVPVLLSGKLLLCTISRVNWLVALRSERICLRHMAARTLGSLLEERTEVDCRVASAKKGPFRQMLQTLLRMKKLSATAFPMAQCTCTPCLQTAESNWLPVESGARQMGQSSTSQFVELCYKHG